MREPLHRFADIHYGKSPTLVTTLDSEIPIYGTGGRYGSATRSLFNGQAVIVARKGSLGNPHLALTPFWASDTTYAVIPKPGVDVRWLYYSLSLFDLTKLNEATGVPSINRDWLRRIELESASPDQQRRIAEILGTVDEVIEQTEALIAKQQQVKAGLMHDLFTRGVTATGQLRPPPAEAPHLYQASPLGQIPNEWNACELRSKLSFISYGFTNPMPEAEEGPYMATAADIHGGRIQYDSCRRTTRKAFDQLLTRKSRPIIGDVLLTKDGTLGRIAVVDREDVCINQSVAVLRPQETRHSAFLAALLSSPRWQDKMIADAGGSTIKHIYITVVDRMLIAWPTNQEEIEAITACITEAAESIAAETAHLAKLRQQKQGLMHDLLTARVPVPA
jgi:type I restriction enzyme S subunit